jgi:phage-related protein
MAFPDIKPTKITIEYDDNTVSTSFDGGYEQRRNRNTRSLKTFKADYFITKENKNLLKAHYEDVQTVTPFVWTNLEDGIDYTVRFEEPIKVIENGTMPNHNNISISVKEV